MISFYTLFKMVRENKKPLIIGNIIAALATLVSIPIPLLIPLLVDEVLLKKEGWLLPFLDSFGIAGEALIYIAIVLVVAIVLKFLHFLFSALSQNYFLSLSQEISLALRSKALRHLQRVSMASYESLGSGKVITHLITDIDTIEQFVGGSLARLIVSISTIIGVGGVLIWINPLFGLLILIFEPLIMVATKKISKNVGKLKKEQNQSISELSDNLTQMCDLFGQIRSSNKEDEFVTRAIDDSSKLKQKSLTYAIKAFVAERFSYTLFSSGFEVFRAIGVIMVLYSDLSVGLMFAIFGYLWFIMTPVQDLLSLQYSYANAKNAIARLNELMSLPLERNTPNPKEWDNNKPINIETKNLIFGYTKPILKGVSIDIKGAQTTAIIGSSGSGKSTLAQLLVGFYEPQSGEIYYNGINSKDISLASIREKVFVVLQSPLMFNDTLEFNLSMGKNFTKDEIWNALKIAQMSEYVKTLKDGLNTQVGKFGIKLSGGQRQRLSIARMILANPKVIVFDESTSALDVHTETQLFEDLAQFLKDKTIIIIAHRLSTVAQADYIYMLENGEVIEEGKKETLEANSKHFKRFVDAQS
ncbi:MAG: ABC transporter ATP-binding protein [Sulfurimonadaceae bacterium]|nr:ABC transporter ATP-binding protein [Sulfurimonadaceae bacterium]